ncbi:hypothetical protein BH09MYX1_BH09MYX1_62930 [soil metagenome]
MSSATDTYEMLWDCKYCSQKKNLGLSHRCCPGCGSPQDPGARYFPGDADKVAAKDHPFFGADVHCPSCTQANSRNSKCCAQCGSPLDKAGAVRTRQDQVGSGFGGETVADARRELGSPPGHAPVAAVPAVPARKKSSLGIILGVVGLGLVLVLVGVFFLLRKRDGAFVVADKTWDRTVAVEQRSLDRGSNWCDSLPAGARALGRHREQRSTKQVPDGQTCVTRRKDQGNGTFKESQECTPKTKSEAVLDDKCDYEAEVWKVDRTAKSHGGAADAPAWPAANLARTGCSSIGCEREGTRSETYSVTLSEPKTGEQSTCAMDAGKWAQIKKGGSYVGKIGAVTGHVDCDSLVVK